MSKTNQQKIKNTLDAFKVIKDRNDAADKADLILTVPTAPAHWYRASGTPLHTIEMTNGGERNTTLRDARKMNLFPSVTTVLKDVLVNYGVQKWLRNTLLESAYTLPESFLLDAGEFPVLVVGILGGQAERLLDEGEFIPTLLGCKVMEEP